MSVATIQRNILSFASFISTRGFFGLFMVATEFLTGMREASVEETDKDLVNRMNGGEDAAFDELYSRYFDKIYAFVIRRVSHHHIAEDIVSKVFLKAFANRKGFVWKVSFNAWIYRIATNTITDHYRTKKADVELNVEIHDQPMSGEIASRQVDIGILGKELEGVLEKLKERDRMAISLKFYSELSNPEIAEALKCKPEHVAVIVHRALKKCQSLTGKELQKML